MLELHAPNLDFDQGERLSREAYKRDFRQRDGAVRDRNSWKLERRQHFEEQGSPSRDALRRGEWELSLRLLDERRGALLASAEEDRRRRSFFHRVRVVEKPMTPYLQWELHSLRQRAEYGEKVRVVAAETLGAAERERPLPELVILGDTTLYEVLYTETGFSNGAVLYTNPRVINQWRRYIEALYLTAEDISTYFHREVEYLPPPHIRVD
ncbi:DUF6879 family protein [Rhizohabitans arisaemae]|uniref:DUF6879 family protein n=1 Tax=Rhizohabitans arisaemae TaxID=2720610 RepID=UPI0024B11351|nr:DUF6879 family protein [Rhizohabitans arisaemae]